MNYTLGEFADEMHRLSDLLDRGLEDLRQHAFEVAHKEAIYRRAKAEAWVRYSLAPFLAAEKMAMVDADVVAHKEARDIAYGLKEAAIESVRSRRAQMSSLQSLLAGHRAEAEFTRTSGFD